MSKKQISVVVSGILLFIGIITYFILSFFGVINDNDLKASVGLLDKKATDCPYSVHFIDVGQGNSTLIMSNGSNMLIDAGETDKGGVVLAYLKAQGVKKLDYIIATHQHTDHIGGIKKMLDSDIEVDNIIMPKVPNKIVPTTYTYEKLLKAIKSNNINLIKADNKSYLLGDSKFETFVTNKTSYKNLNDYSVMTRVTINDKTFLICGDSSTKREKELIDTGADIFADVINVGHHGSRYSSSAKFLKKVNADYSVIQCGVGNSYNHPHEEAVKRLKKYTKTILMNSKNGTIVFEVKDTLTAKIEKE